MQLIIQPNNNSELIFEIDVNIYCFSSGNWFLWIILLLIASPSGLVS